MATFKVRNTNNTGWIDIQTEGPIGPQGSSGPQGNQGYQGLTGSQGPSGPQGNQGIKGDDGNIGPQGPSGSQGYQGFQGNQGTTGLTGSQGPIGPQGFQGYQGTNGELGTIGPQGPSGSQGPQGNQGYQGFQGYQGNIGPQGLTGSQGASGPQGFQGNQGYQGNQGVPGEGIPDTGIFTIIRDFAVSDSLFTPVAVFGNSNLDRGVAIGTYHNSHGAAGINPICLSTMTIPWGYNLHINCDGVGTTYLNAEGGSVGIGSLIQNYSGVANTTIALETDGMCGVELVGTSAADGNNLALIEAVSATNAEGYQRQSDILVTMEGVTNIKRGSRITLRTKPDDTTGPPIGRMVVTQEGNFCFGHGINPGGNNSNVFTFKQSTVTQDAPNEDTCWMYFVDQPNANGNTVPTFRTENGAIIRLYQELGLTSQLTQLSHNTPSTYDYITGTPVSGGIGFTSANSFNTVMAIISNLQTRVFELEEKLQRIGFLA